MKKHNSLMLLFALLLIPALFFAAKGGKDKGGMEDGDTAQTVIFDDLEFEIYGDGLGIYIHGTDGQITIPGQFHVVEIGHGDFPRWLGRRGAPAAGVGGQGVSEAGKGRRPPEGAPERRAGRREGP